MGAGAAALKLADGVDGAALRRVLEGADPSTGDPLGRHAAARVPGFDVTFSAPKSVSVLFGIGDERLRATIRRAHETAVRDAFAYLEREAAVARRGAAGAISVRGRGFVAAAFRHRTSRAGDPQLHTHVLVANLVQADDGRWSALDGRRLYAHGKTAGYLYEARLRAELTRELGVAWTPVRNGIADVDGVPADVLRAFSRRRAQIEAALEERGASGPRAAQAAALDTRRRKEHDVDPAMLVPAWRARAEELGFGHEQLEALLGRDAPSLDGELLASVARELAGERGLTEHKSSFTRRDALQAWASRLPAGAPVDVALLERLADHFLASSHAVPLAVGESVSSRDALLRRQDGRLVRALPDERRYSTPALLLQERRLLDRARAGVASGRGLATAEAVGAAIAGRPTLSGEQAAMVSRLTTSRRRVLRRRGPGRRGQDVRAGDGTGGVGGERRSRGGRRRRVAGGARARARGRHPEHQPRRAARAHAGPPTASSLRRRPRRGGDGRHAAALRALGASPASGREAGARRRSSPAAGDRRGWRLPCAAQTAAGDRARGEPAPGGGMGARRARPAPRRAGTRRAARLRGARPDHDGRRRGDPCAAGGRLGGGRRPETVRS